MRTTYRIAALILALWPLAGRAADVCATTLEGLTQTERLRAVHELFLPPAATDPLSNELSPPDPSSQAHRSELAGSNSNKAPVVLGLVNGTRGSYVAISSNESGLHIEFYTSALFDLYPITRDSPLKFCDTGHSLRMIGLDRDEELTIRDHQFIFGEGSPKQTFSIGEMPELLRKLNHLDDRGLAGVK